MVRHVYHVCYRMIGGDVRWVDVLADSKAEAYEWAVYELIPQIEDGEAPYSAWVTSVTYNNGRVRNFNTFEGNPY